MYVSFGFCVIFEKNLCGHDLDETIARRLPPKGLKSGGHFLLKSFGRAAARREKKIEILEMPFSDHKIVPPRANGHNLRAINGDQDMVNCDKCEAIYIKRVARAARRGKF
uniref:Uncharacterized protein n=1 Tax=Photinus pyralis TaxID=7054 RepID=A0A1Y1KAP8_PHOPY